MANQTIGLTATLDTRSFEAGVRRYVRGIREMEQAARSAGSNTRGLQDNLGNFGGGGITGSLGGISTGLAAIGTAAIAATAAVAGLAATSLSMAATFEQSVANVAAVMGKPIEDIAPLQALIEELAIDPNLKVSMEEAAAASEMLGKNGVTMEQQLDGALKSVIELSNATGEDMSLAADTVTDAMAIFGVEAENTGQVVDSITATLLNSKLGLNDYRLALARGGANVKNFGIELDDFNAVLIKTSPNFASGMTQGTAFSDMINRLVAPTDIAKKALAELGVQVADAQGNFKPLMQIVQEFDEAVNGVVTSTIEVGGRTEEQNELLDDLTRQYDNATQKLWEYEKGIRGIAESENDKIVSIDRLHRLQAALLPQIQELEAVQGQQIATTRKLTEAEREEYKQTIFLNTGKQMFNAISGETVTSMEALKDATISEGLAAEAAATRTDTLIGRFTTLKDIIAAIGTEAAKPFLEPIKLQIEDLNTALSQSLTQFKEGGLASFMGEFSDEDFEAWSNVLKVGAINAIEDFAKSIIDGIPIINDSLQSFSDSIIMALIDPAIQVKISEVGAQFGAFIGQSLVDFFDDDNKTKEALNALVSSMFRAIGATALSIAAIGGSFVAHVVSGIVEAMGGGKLQVMTIEQFIKLSKDISTTMSDYLINGTPLQDFYDYVINVFNDMYMELVGNSIVPDMVDAILSEFDRLVSGAGERLAQMYNAIQPPDLGISEMIFGEDGGQGEGVNENLVNIIDILPNAGQQIDQLKNSMIDLGGAINNSVNPVLTQMFSKIDTLLTPAIVVEAGTINTQLIPALQGLNNIIVLVVQALGEQIKEISRVTDKMSDEKEAVKELTDFYSSLADAIRDTNTARAGTPDTGGAVPPGFASGGQFIVPEGYGGYGMPIRVHSGELVSILTRGQTQKWKAQQRNVSQSKHITSSASTNNNSVNNFNLTVQSQTGTKNIARSFALMKAKAGI